MVEYCASHQHRRNFGAEFKRFCIRIPGVAKSVLARKTIAEIAPPERRCRICRNRRERLANRRHSWSRVVLRNTASKHVRCTADTKIAEHSAGLGGILILRFVDHP